MLKSSLIKETLKKKYNILHISLSPDPEAITCPCGFIWTLKTPSFGFNIMINKKKRWRFEKYIHKSYSMTSQQHIWSTKRWCSWNISTLDILINLFINKKKKEEESEREKKVLIPFHFNFCWWHREGQLTDAEVGTMLLFWLRTISPFERFTIWDPSSTSSCFLFGRGASIVFSKRQIKRVVIWIAFDWLHSREKWMHHKFFFFFSIWNLEFGFKKKL